MDIGFIHSIYTIVVAVIFVGIVFWAFDARSKPRLDSAARIPLDDDDAPGAAYSKEKNNA